MNNSNLFPISREGWTYIGYSIVLFLLLGFLDLEFLQFFSFLLVMFFLYVYRNPERQMPAFEKGGVVSPVDGRVIDIKEDSTGVVSLKFDSSYHDVSVLRVPLESKVKSLEMQKGATLSKNSPKSDILNEKLSIYLEGSKRRVIKLTHKSVLNFSPIAYDLTESEKLIQGSRYGVMPKGITEIVFPKGTKVNVQVGTEVKACESVIAYLS